MEEIKKLVTWAEERGFVVKIFTHHDLYVVNVGPIDGVDSKLEIAAQKALEISGRLL